MSHVNTNVIYPQSTDRTASWQVREDGDDYGNSKGRSGPSYPLVGLQDRLNDRLHRAHAIASLLHSADYLLEKDTRETALVLEELIEQAQEASAQMWERIRQEKKDC